MILRALRVEGWRCFADPVETGPLSERIHVIHAPNGTGKSTLFEALRSALFERHSTKSEAAKSFLTPWGRELSPRVTVEFAHGGAEYRLVKQFFAGASCELSRREGGRFVRLAEGAAADDRVRRLFTKSGFSPRYKPFDDMGIFAALWAPQGRLELGELSPEVVGFVRDSLGAQVAAPGTDALEAVVEKAYAEFFTPKGQARRGAEAPRLASIEAEREDVALREREAIVKLERFEELQLRVREHHDLRALAEREAAEEEKRLVEVRARAREYGKLVAERDACRASVTVAESEYRALSERVDGLARLRKARRLAAERAEKLAADRVAAEGAVAEREAANEAAKVHRERAREARLALAGARREADQAEALERARAEAKAAAGLLGRVTAAAAELEAAQERRAGLVAPPDDVLAELASAIRSRDEARARLDAGALRLTVELVEGGRVEITEGDEEGSRDLAAGESVEVRGAPGAAAEIPGVARIRARGPDGDLGEWKEALSEAEARISELAGEWGTADPAELEALREQARSREAQVEKAKAVLDAGLAGRVREDLVAAEARARKSVETILAARPGWEDEPPDPGSLRDALDAREAEAGREEAEAGETRDRAEGDLSRAREERVRLATEEGAARKEIRELDLRIAEEEADGRTPEEREALSRELAMARQAAAGRLEAAEKRLLEIGEDPREEAELREKRAEEHRQAAEEARTRARTEESRLADLAAEGAWSKRAEAAERLADLDGEIRREERRRDAAKLLAETVRACRAEAVQAVAGPVAAAATRTFTRIAGSRLGGVRVGETLAPEAVTPGLAEEPVAEGALSGGEREQLHLSVRLALAEALAKEERQLVVLDDILSATDGGRLARVLRVLEEAAEKLQIVILTCHPERYAGLEGAERLDLYEVVRG